MYFHSLVQSPIFPSPLRETGAFYALSASLRADFATGASRAGGVASADRRGARNQAPVADARAPDGTETLDPVLGRSSKELKAWVCQRPAGAVFADVA